MFTRIVRTGLSRTVSTPAIPAQWTTCVAPRTTSVEPRRIEHVALDELEVRMLRERRAAERVPVEVVERDDLVRVDESARERRADEAGAAGDHDPFPAQWHAGESRCRPPGPRPLRPGRRRRSATVLRFRHAQRSPCSSRRSGARRMRRRRSGRRPHRDVADDHVLGEGARTAKPVSLDAPLRPAPAERFGARASRAGRLAAGGVKLFAPVPRDAVCTEIYGGPQVARVVGRVNGKRVWASFNRANGCHISRWDRLAPWLLPSAACNARVTIGAREDRPLRRRGRHQRRAIEHARARGLRVAAVDRNEAAPGLAPPTSPRSSTSPTSRPSRRSAPRRGRRRADGLCGPGCARSSRLSRRISGSRASDARRPTG